MPGSGPTALSSGSRRTWHRGRRRQPLRRLPEPLHGAGPRRRQCRLLRRSAEGRRQQRLGDGRWGRSPAYDEYLGRTVEPWSYLKSTYFKPLGYPAGIYRVGPLARLNVAERLGTSGPTPSLPNTATGWGATPPAPSITTTARLIEIVHCIDVIDEILSRPDILDPHVRARAQINRNEGVVSPRLPAGCSSTTTRSTTTVWWSG